MKTKIIFCLFLCFSSNLFCSNNDTLAIDSIPELERKKPIDVPVWTLFVPGASYFVQGKIAEGSVFAALEIGLIYTGIKYQQDLSLGNNSPYYNFPYLLGSKFYEIEKLTFLKSILAKFKYDDPAFRYDDLSDKDLFLAPFKLENILTPITLGMIGAATGAIIIETAFSKVQNTCVSDVDKMYFINRYIDRNSGLALYGAVSMVAGWGAGVSEEYEFRNFVMPMLDYQIGETGGLICSSLIFGGIHFLNILNVPEEKRDYQAALLQVCEASIIGYFLGNDVQKRGYKIGPAVAAHAWYDIVLMLGSFIINPHDNFLGVKMQYKF